MIYLPVKVTRKIRLELALLVLCLEYIEYLFISIYTRNLGRWDVIILYKIESGIERVNKSQSVLLIKKLGSTKSCKSIQHNKRE